MEGIYAGVVLHQRVPSMEEAMVSSGKKRDAGNAGAGRRNGEGPEFGELTDDEHEGMRQAHAKPSGGCTRIIQQQTTIIIASTETRRWTGRWGRDNE